MDNKVKQHSLQVHPAVLERQRFYDWHKMAAGDRPVRGEMMIRIIVAFMLVFIVFPGCQNEANMINEIPKIYDEEDDARQNIQMAINKAQKEEKRVLLMFGGNWCPWCHRLHHLFKNDPNVKEILEKKYILVMINVGDDKERMDMELNETYGNPFQYGFSVLVVLDKDGIQLTIQETGSLEKAEEEGEEKGHDPTRVLAFLERWK